MSKIKSHFRRKSRSNNILLNQNRKSFKNYFIQNRNEKIVFKPIENQVLLLKKQVLLKAKDHQLSQTEIKKNKNTLRKSMDDIYVDKQKIKIRLSFKNQIKKVQSNIKDFTLNLSNIQKQLNSQLYKKQILTQVNKLIKTQIINQQIQQKNSIQNQQQQFQLKQIQKLRQKIQKIKSQINKTKNSSQKLLDQIQNERRNRVMFESKLAKIQKEIRQYQNIYTALLMKSLENKFLYILTSGNDLVSNGHVVGLKKQNTEQNQKQLNRNLYMCMPNSKPNCKEIQGDSFKISSKYIGKKKTLNKLAKILNFAQTSKAIEQSQLQLYHQQDYLRSQIKNGKDPSIFDLTSPNNQYGNWSKSKSKKVNGRSGRIISIKFFPQDGNRNKQFFDAIVYELFRVYQSLGINMLGVNGFRRQQSVKGNKQRENFFSYDSDLVVDESQLRLQFIRKSQQRMMELNQFYHRELVSLEEEIQEKERMIELMNQRRKKKEFEVVFVDGDDNNGMIEEQYESIRMYEQIRTILSMKNDNKTSNGNNNRPSERLMDDDGKTVTNFIEQLLRMQKQTKSQSNKSQIGDPQQLDPQNDLQLFGQNDEKNITRRVNTTGVYRNSNNNYLRQTNSHEHSVQQSKRNSINNLLVKNKQVLITQVGEKNTEKKYIHSQVKTEGTERKFHLLMKQPKHETLLSNQSQLNSVKSLNNIFDNMRTFRSYEKAFQREDFQKQYQKEIKKMKRHLFKRQARILKTKLN